MDAWAARLFQRIDDGIDRSAAHRCIATKSVGCAQRPRDLVALRSGLRGDRQSVGDRNACSRAAENRSCAGPLRRQDFHVRCAGADRLYPEFRRRRRRCRICQGPFANQPGRGRRWHVPELYGRGFGRRQAGTNRRAADRFIRKKNGG